MLGQAGPGTSLRLGSASCPAPGRMPGDIALILPFRPHPPPQRLRAQSGTNPNQWGWGVGGINWASVFTILFVAPFSLVS